MKYSRFILVFLIAVCLSLSLSSFAIPKVSATTDSVTLVSNFPIGPCTPAVTYWEYFNSADALTKVPVSTSGVTVSAYVNSFTFPISSGTCAASPLSYGLVGYWPMDEATSGTATNVFDLSGNNLTLATTGSPKYVTGKYGGAINFTSSSQSATASTLTASGSFTIIVWLYLYSLPSGQNQKYFGFRATSGNYQGMDIRDCGTSSQFQFEFVNNTGTASRACTISYVSLKSWYFLSEVFNSTAGTVIGTLANSTYSLSRTVKASGAGSISETNALEGIHFDSIAAIATEDDGRIYNSALSSPQISELYSSTIPNLETQVTQPQTITTNFYPQYLTYLGKSTSYNSIGQILNTGSLAGNYWQDGQLTVSAPNTSNDNFLAIFPLILAVGMVLVKRRRKELPTPNQQKR